MVSKRPRKLSALVASSLALLSMAPVALADAPAQLERCYEELAVLSETPLRTLDRYPRYLLQRYQTLPGTEASAELAACETRLSALVTENRQLHPGLLNKLCSQSERVPRDYAGLQTYLMGIPSLQCESRWFDALTPAQWQQLQPQLARINNLEQECTRALEALDRGGRLREQLAQTTGRLISLSRRVFTAQWRTTLAGLPDDVAAALVEREQQLDQCEHVLTEQLAAAHVE
ncbi:MAG: hypothetical protein ABJZ98_12460 [Saccharospirillum sp.]|uniref:hypothetical protein n=2 Tax=Saccharospirillum sp. TaxID=2033801 RepID=UPI00329A1931